MVKFTMSSINEQQNPRGGGGGVEREKEGRKGKLFSCCREGEVKKVAAFFWLFLLAKKPKLFYQTFSRYKLGEGGILPLFGGGKETNTADYKRQPPSPQVETLFFVFPSLSSLFHSVFPGLTHSHTPLSLPCPSNPQKPSGGGDRCDFLPQKESTKGGGGGGSEGRKT